MTTEKKNMEETIENNDTVKDSEEIKIEITDKTEPEVAQEKQAETKEPEQPDYLQKLQYVQAEFQNYKKRTEKRMADYHKFSQRNVLQKLLPVLDDFDILFSHNNEDEEHVNMKGVKLIQNKLMTLLGELGLQSVEAQGEMFDPNHHEAVLMEEADGVEEGTILKVWQQGYMHNDVLLRPAKVVTAKAKADEAENAGE